MAQRIGKYKVSKREAAISAVDGAVIVGSLTGITNLSATGTITLSGLETITGSAYDTGRLFQTGSGYLSHSGLIAGGVSTKSGSFNVVCVSK